MKDKTSTIRAPVEDVDYAEKFAAIMRFEHKGE